MQLTPVNINYDNESVTSGLLEYRKKIDKLLHGLTDDLENYGLNCVVAKFCEMTNLIAEIDVKTGKSLIDEGICILIRIIEPFLPHLAESLWQGIGGQPWAKADESLLVDDTVTIAVQINGKLRKTIKVAINLPQAESLASLVDNILGSISYKLKVGVGYEITSQIIGAVGVTAGGQLSGIKALQTSDATLEVGIRYNF